MDSLNKPNLDQIKKLDNALLNGLTNQQMQQVCELMQLTRVEKGDLILKEGDLSDDVFIILDGSVDVVKKEKESGEV